MDGMSTLAGINRQNGKLNESEGGGKVAISEVNCGLAMLASGRHSATCFCPFVQLHFILLAKTYTKDSIAPLEIALDRTPYDCL